MATGSGKTVIMAGLILYLYTKGICDYESQSGGLEYGDGRFEHYGWNSQDISVLDILIEHPVR